MKKVVSMFLALTMALSFSACRVAKPEDTIDSYLAAYKVFDTEKMDSYVLVPDNATDETMAEDDDAYINFFVDYIKENANKMTYRITNSEMSGSNAVVTVEFKYVDGSPLMRSVMGVFMQRMFAEAFSGKESSDEDVEGMLTELLHQEIGKTIEIYKEVTLQIDCVLQDKTWHIATESDALQDVLTSGVFFTMQDMGES